jgi:membrane-associated phospholipid phosphatase
VTGIGRREFGTAAAALVLAYLVLTAVWAGLGFLVTGPLAGSWVGALDTRVEGWLLERRTPAWDTWTSVGSMLAETWIKIVVTALVAVAMLIVWRSWREPLLVCAALVLEAAVFITVTWIVSRPRPDVPALEEVSVDTSFPSGHAAAAAAYAAIAVVIFERTRNPWIRGVTVLAAVAIPLIVGASRMYRGVHYLTDVVAGILLGAVCVIAVVVIVRRCFPNPRGGDDALPRAQRLDPAGGATRGGEPSVGGE